MSNMTELTPTIIAADEAQEIMRDDAVARLSADVLCPLARAIEAALAALDRAIEARKPD